MKIRARLGLGLVALQLIAVGGLGCSHASTDSPAVTPPVLPPPVSITGLSETTGPVGDTLSLMGWGFTGATAVTLNALSVNYSVLSDTHLLVTVPAGAASGLFSVVAPKGTSSAKTTFTVAAPSAIPMIVSMDSDATAPGSLVTIHGSYFNKVTAVSFNGLPSPSFQVLNQGTLQAMVPLGATTGSVEVTTSLGTGSSPQPMRIMSAQILVNPTFELGSTGWDGQPWWAVSDYFQGTFDVAPHSGHVYGILGTTGAQGLWQTVTIPAGATAAKLGLWLSLETSETTKNDTLALNVADPLGNLLGTVHTFDSASTAQDWTYTSFDLSAYAGQTVQVRFDRTTDPADATSGAWSVWYIDDVNLWVDLPTAAPPPSLTAILPGAGLPGTTWMTLTGQNLLGAAEVDFNGVPATAFQQVDAQTLRALVPATATSGPVTVKTSHGQATSATGFIAMAPLANLIQNGDFEQGPTGWSQNVVDRRTLQTLSPDPHSGMFYGKIGGYGYAYTDTLAQTVTFPAGASRITLSYWLNLTNYAFGPNDTFSVVVLDPVTKDVLGTEQTITAMDGAHQWSQSTVDLTKYAGREVVLQFTSVEQNGGPATWFVDDVALYVEGASTILAPGLSGTITPAFGFAGETPVTIPGRNLQYATAVLFNGVPATSFTAGPTGVTAVIPATATSGPITVNTPSGTQVTQASYPVVPIPVNLVVNSSLDTGAQSWSPAGYVDNAVLWKSWGDAVMPTAHSGAFYSWIGGMGTTGEQTFQQTLTIPATLSRATLTYWLSMISAENRPGYDTYKLHVIDVASGAVGTPQILDATAFPSSVWTYQMVDLTPWKGKTVTLSFVSDETADLATSWFVDDVHLYAEGTTTDITPGVSSALPVMGFPGQTVVTLTGTNLYDATQVTFNGVASTAWTLLSPTQIVATVPAGAGTGAIQVTTTHGSAPAGTFTVVPSSPNLVSNGDFAGGPAGWTAPANTIVDNNPYYAALPIFGTGEAYLYGTSTLAQAVTIPSGSKMARLTFWMNENTNGSDASDHFSVQVEDTNGNPLSGSPLLDVNEQNGHSGIWWPYDLDLSPYAGQTIQLVFTSNGSQTYSYFLENIGVGVSASGAAFAPTITQVLPAVAAPGSTWLQLTGTQFLAKPVVSFGTVPATAVTIQDPQHMMVQVPAGAPAGPVTVASDGFNAVSAAPVAMVTGNLLGNSDFEQGPKDWTPTASIVNTAGQTSPVSRSGSWMANVGGMNAATTDTLTQDVAIPTGVQAATLRFWLQRSTQDTAGVDTWQVRVLDPTTNLPLPNGVLQTLTSLTGPMDWTCFTLDMGAFIGQTVRISLESHETLSLPGKGNFGTIWYLDDVELLVNGSASVLQPAISGLAPQSGFAGETQVTLSGLNLLGTTGVAFNGIPAAWTQGSGTQILATVPPGATTGPVTLAGPGGPVSGPVFTVNQHTATPSAMMPTTGPTGSKVFLQGQYLDQAAQVIIGAVPIPFTIQDASNLILQIPPQAATGVVTVLSNSGATAKAGTFTVDNSKPLVQILLDRVSITQGTQTSSESVPLVLNRSALVRAFVRATGPNALNPTVAVTLMDATGKVLMTKTAAAQAPEVSQAPQYDDFVGSVNVSFPSAVMQNGVSVQVTLDPVNQIPQVDPDHRVWPAGGGTQPLVLADTRPMKITFVPLQYTYSGTTYTGLIDTGTPGNTVTDFAKGLTRVWPLPDQADVALRDVFVSQGCPGANYEAGTWEFILNELLAARIVDMNLDRYYYGVVSAYWGYGGTGKSWLGQPSSMGVDWGYQPNGSSFATNAGTVMHEIGHALSRPHSPCGGAASPDPNYPYVLGEIGTTGFDLWATGNDTQVYSSVNTHDTMAYCGYNWVSDYGYKKVLEFRTDGLDSTLATSSAGPVDCLVVWGLVDNGVVSLNPSFIAHTLPTATDKSDSYEVDIRDAQGGALGHGTFEPKQSSDGPSGSVQGFVVAIPYTGGTLPTLPTLKVIRNGQPMASQQGKAGAHQALIAGSMVKPMAVRTAGNVAFTWDAQQHPLAVIKNDKGQVISFARGGSITLPTASKQLEVHFSDGITSVKQMIDVD